MTTVLKADKQPEHCSRELSRSVRSFLEKEIFPRLPIEATQLPNACQLNPLIDLYRDQENNKLLVHHPDEWKCSYCSKRFKSQFYIDRHMSNKHSDRLLNNGTSVCLGDLSSVFGCQSSVTSTSKSRRMDSRDDLNSPRGYRNSDGKNAFSSITSCTTAEVVKTKYRCEVMMRRCFANLDNGQELLKEFQTTICDEVHCDNGILKGNQIYKNDKTELVFITWLFQLLGVVIIIGIAFLYAISVGISFSPFGRSRDRGPKKTKLKKRD